MNPTNNKLKSKQGFFSSIFTIKQRFCNKIIIKLDRIIAKCADRKQKEEIDNKLKDLEDFQNFSNVFNKNKSLLEDGINDLKLTNIFYRDTLEQLFFYFNSGNYKEVNRIFSELGFTQINNLENK